MPVLFVLTPAELDEAESLSRPDVVLMAGPSWDAGTVNVVRDLFPEARLVACAPPTHGRVLRSAIYREFDGIVWDSRVDSALEPTILAVQVGMLVVPRDTDRTPPPSLSNREKQALSLVIMGLTNHEIADRLYISESTVKSHLHSAYRKLGVHSRSEAARLIADPTEGLGTGILAITSTRGAGGRNDDERG